MERRCHRHEIDFQDYSGSSGTIANITVTTPGLGGTDAKMRVNITSTTAVYYSRGLDWSAFEPELLIRVHIDPNTLTMASGDVFTFLNVRSGANQLLFLSLRYDGASYEISGGCSNDAISTQSFSNYDITDAEHVVEIYLLRATSVSANNGSCILRVDGTNKQTISSIDCYNVFNSMSSLWVGATAGIDAGTSGVFYLDEVSLRDDDLWPGSYAVPAGTTYYVSNAGSNSSNGTSTSTPWQTLTKVYDEFANGLFNADDQILFRAGDTFTATNSAHLRVRNVQGTRIDKPITIGRYGAGANPIFACSSMSGNAVVYGWWAVDFVYIHSLDIQNAPFGVSLQNGSRGWRFYALSLTNVDESYAMQFYQSDFIQVISCIIDTVETEGIYLGHSGASANSTQAICYANIISGCGADAIDLKQASLGCVLRQNTIHDCVTLTSGTLFGNAGIDIRGDNHVIRENNIYDIGTTGSSGYVYIGGMIVEDNDTVGIRIEFNRIRNIIRHAAVPGFGMKVMGNGNHKILNNTLYQTDDDGIVVSDDSGSPASTVKNNVVHTATDGIQIQNSVLPVSYTNTYYNTTNNTRVFGTAKTIATACAQNGIECSSTTSNPAFVSTTDLTINESSPAFETAETAAMPIQLFDDLLSKGWHQPNEALPYCLLKDGFETQAFGFWTTAVTDSGKLSISAAAAIQAGNWGMQALINNTNVKYVERSGFGTPRNCHVRIYFDPGGITMASGDEFDIVQIRSSGANLARLVFGYNGSSYYLRFISAEDGSVIIHSSSKYTITDAAHYAEISYHASAVSAYNRGYSILKIDGAYKEAFFDMDSYLSVTDAVRVGVCTAPDATVSGTVFFDEVIIDNVGNDLDATATGQATGAAVGPQSGEVEMTNVGEFLGIPGLRGYWPMNAFDSGANAMDLSANGRTLTYNGNPLYDVHAAGGPYIELDGTGDFLSRADEAGLDITGTESYIASTARGLTMGAWVWADAIGSNQAILTKDNTTSRSYSLYISTAGKGVVEVFGASTGTVTSTDTLAASNWYFVVARYVPGTSVDVYVNNNKTPSTSTIPASLSNSSAAFQVGARNSTMLLNGRVGMCFLCAASLSDTSIGTIYQNTKAFYGL